MKVILLSQAAVAMKPGIEREHAVVLRVRFAMLSTSGPSVPLLTSAVDFLPVARLVSSNFFSAMSLVPVDDSGARMPADSTFLQVQIGRADLHDAAARIKRARARGPAIGA